MPHYLTRLATRSCKTHAIGYVVEAALKLLQEEFASDAGLASSALEIVAELLFQREVDTFGFLFLAELKSVTNDLGFTVFSVLFGGEVSLLYRTLLSETLCSLEKQLHAFATAKAAYWTFIACHFFSKLRVAIGLQAACPSSRSILFLRCIWPRLRHHQAVAVGILRPEFALGQIFRITNLADLHTLNDQTIAQVRQIRCVQIKQNQL